MRRPFTPSAPFALALCLVSSAAVAAPFEIDFSARVTHVGDPLGIVGSLAGIGDVVTGRVLYDTAASDGYADDPTRGSYLSPGLLEVMLDGMTFSYSGGVLLDVLHHGNGDQELFQVLVPPDLPAASPTWPAALPLFPFWRIGFGIGQNTDHTLFSSDALPTALDLALADFANGEIVSSTRDMTMYDIHFHITDLTIAPVPVPEPAMLSGLGLLAVLYRRVSNTRIRSRRE